MSAIVSTNYRELAPEEVDQVAKECALAWQDPEIPLRQFEQAVKGELEAWRKGKSIAPFDAIVRCMLAIPFAHRVDFPKFLDIGASSGYYSEVLSQRYLFFLNYTACDYSPAFKELAAKLYPRLPFDVADCTALPYRDDSFDIVLSGACLMHVANYAQAIREAVRVSNRYVIFHRTPIVPEGPTKFWEKDAYGVRCLEVHFDEAELTELFSENDLTELYRTDVFVDESSGFLHRSYLLKKAEGLRHVQV